MPIQSSSPVVLALLLLLLVDVALVAVVRDVPPGTERGSFQVLYTT